MITSKKPSPYLVRQAGYTSLTPVAFQKLIGVCFNEPELLMEALTHSSTASESQRKHPEYEVRWNERLEFLGDSVLGLVISSFLIEQDSKFKEGELSKIRAALIREATLANLAREIRLGDALIMSNGERKSGGAEKDSLLADALEALFGAILLDQGYESARSFILKLFDLENERSLDRLIQSDHKTMLQEMLQKSFKARPVYAVTRSEGPEHSLSFTVEVTFNGSVLGKGVGSTKKRASQEAASHALKAFKKNPELMNKLSLEDVNQ